jgi:hypothetical protein
VQFKFWLQPGQGQALEQAMIQAEVAGNEILEVDEVNQKILVAHTSSGPLWGCRFCLEEGKIVIVDTEEELNVHAREVHGWSE